MKKISFILSIASLILISSCSKKLNQIPLSSATTATFYKQPSDFIQGVNAAYNSLRPYPDLLAFLSEVRSDNLYGVSVAGRDWDPINDFATGIAPNTYVEQAWNNDYVGIFNANTVLDQISKNGTYINSTALSTRLQAESQFLRAFFYFDLVKYYGMVPVVTQPVSSATALTIKRSAVTDVYALIISDLQFAISNLPSNYAGTFPAYTATDAGRATKFAAEALLAKVYMARSGPTLNISGPGLGLSEWSLALPLLQDVITNGGFVFNTNYANIFSYANQNPTVNKEAVFDIMYVGGTAVSGGSGLGSTLGADYVWQLAPATYFTSLGANSQANGSLEMIPVSNNFMSSYETGDLRKAATVFTAGYTLSGNTENRPFFKKWIDITKIPTTNRFDWAENFIAIRYTDILMCKAECILNGASGAQTDVDAIINQVRTRAGLPSKTNITLTQLFDERRREFADEGQRWFDLQRNGNMVTIMNNFIATEDVGHRMAQAQANFTLYPVPQTQLDAAPGLYVQNPGY